MAGRFLTTSDPLLSVLPQSVRPTVGPASDIPSCYRKPTHEYSDIDLWKFMNL